MENNAKGSETVLKELGVRTPRILLPGDGVDYQAWAVIACDQFTQDRAYWEGVEKIVSDKPSALRIVLPEIDLASADERLPALHDTMRRYRDNVLTRQPGGCALTRRTARGRTRLGLIAAVDLECYDYSGGSSSLIRATEGTILERLPPRMKVRQGACLESPHILLLIDDPERTAIEPLFGLTDALDVLYDFDLMMDGGRVQGWAVSEDKYLSGFGEALRRLASADHQRARYGDAYCGAPLLFAVGDGNHSLACAKACWEEMKKALTPEEEDGHPARYALVEIVNLHDAGLVFEPIHRALFGVEPQDALRDLATYLKVNGGSGGHQTFHSVSARGETAVHTATAPHRLAVGSLQGWIDEYMASHPDVRVDYIHGEDEARALGARESALAFLLPAMPKGDLFASVMREGALPRKTFSMGEARDKRYYLECRAIQR